MKMRVSRLEASAKAASAKDEPANRGKNEPRTVAKNEPRTVRKKTAGRNQVRAESPAKTAPVDKNKRHKKR